MCQHFAHTSCMGMKFPVPQRIKTTDYWCEMTQQLSHLKRVHLEKNLFEIKFTTHFEYTLSCWLAVLSDRELRLLYPSMLSSEPPDSLDKQCNFTSQNTEVGFYGGTPVCFSKSGARRLSFTAGNTMNKCLIQTHLKESNLTLEPFLLHNHQVKISCFYLQS